MYEPTSLYNINILSLKKSLKLYLCYIKYADSIKHKIINNFYYKYYAVILYYKSNVQYSINFLLS